LTKKIIFIADFFLEQGVLGGAEVFNDELINMLSDQLYVVEKINSSNFVDQHGEEVFYIVSNFMGLSNIAKKSIMSKKYIILEHDHKYVSTNDPSKFINMLAPSQYITNREFFESATAVFCQSKIHSEVLQKNLLIDSVINIGCNLWSEYHLDLLESLIGTKKDKKNVILHSNNKNKGTSYAIDYCNKNNIDFEFIMACGYEEFISQLASSRRLFFFPQWLESFNRVIVEARILGCKVTSNKLVGATSEEWFRQLKGKKLAKFIRNQRVNICQKFIDAIEGKDLKFIPPLDLPKISIITSMYRAAKYIEHFMSEVTKQTIFSNCELIILDANSPDDEINEIKKYIEKYDNIIYKRLDTTQTVQETMNLGISMSSNEYITLWNVDDTRSYKALEILSKTLLVDPSVGLVYAGSYQTDVENETFEINSSNGKKYEHSVFEFSKENMIKCLPGPLPMWRRSMTDKVGLFDESLKYAGDWDMWLRCVASGFSFKKVPHDLGLYYMNPEGLSTSADNSVDRLKEESVIFYKYKHVFGDTVFKKFKGYFNE
jgi:glycosyltransferase involved in cell wall biosynthesis